MGAQSRTLLDSIKSNHAYRRKHCNNNNHNEEFNNSKSMPLMVHNDSKGSWLLLRKLSVIVEVMTEARQFRQHHHDTPQATRLFTRLLGYTDTIEQVGAHIRTREYIETPYDEFGIVDKKELLRSVMGSVSTEFYWGGSYEGPHHLMWPRRFYEGDGLSLRKKIPMHFRSSQTLRVILPRDLHDYLHKVTEPPIAPPLDVMEQYYREQAQVLHLYSIVRYHGLKDSPMTHDAKERFRLARLHDELAELEDGVLGVLPNREHLAALPLHEARQALRALARVQGLSNDESCKAAFFDSLPDAA